MKQLRKSISFFLITVLIVTNMNLTSFAMCDNTTKEVPTNTVIEVDDIEELCENVESLEIGDISDSTYGSKRLLVITTAETFDTYDANSVIKYGDFYVLSYTTKGATKKAFNALKTDINVEKVEVDSILETETTAYVTDEDTYTSNSVKTSLGNFLETKEATKKIQVAILDTGIDMSKFKNVIDTGLNLSTSGESNSIIDDNGHGTKIASLIMENANDNVELLPIKVANSEGKATILNAYLGIQQAIENDADIINISMTAMKSVTSDILNEAINEAYSKGIYTVVSAGNNSKSTEEVAPADAKNAIVVSAVNSDNLFADYSNYGPTIDFSAQGVYKGEKGTSYAAARVTGIFANALTKGISIEDMTQYAEDLGNKGVDNYYGHGLLSLNMLKTDTSNAEETITDNEDSVLKVLTSSIPNEMNIASVTTGLVYKTNRFPVAYSSGYLQQSAPSSVGSGVSTYTGDNGEELYKGTNTTKKDDCYLFYNNAAIYVDSSGNVKTLDLKMYVWSGAGYWYASKDYRIIKGGNNTTTMEFHFYEAGTSIESDFKGILKFYDLDDGEGVLLYQGYDNYYTTGSSSYLSYVPIGGNNTSENNPFQHAGGATYPYFFGEQAAVNADEQAVWVEINSTASKPFRCEYGNRDTLSLYLGIDYQGTPIDYYVDGVKKSTLYCATYGTHILASPSSVAGAKVGHSYFNGWYTNADFSGTKYNVGSSLNVDNTTISLYTYSTPNTYTLTVNPNGGTMLNSAGVSTTSTWTKSFTYGDNVCYISTGTEGSYSADWVAGSKPTRTGYTFSGWEVTTGGGSTGQRLFSPWWDFDTNYAGNVTVSAKWTPNTYTLTVNPNGGTMLNSAGVSTTSTWTKSFAYNDNVCYISTGTEGFNNADFLAGSKPTRTGYTFTGWKITSGGGSVGQRLFSPWWDFDASYAGNVTVSAQWTPNTNTAYIVKHWKQNTNNSSHTLAETESKTGTTATTATPPVKTYTGFTSPSTQTVTIAADGSTVVNYYYTRNSYTVTCKDVLNSTSGTVLGTSTWSALYGSTASGSTKGTVTTVGTYYTGYQYSSCTSGTVTENGITVYRIFTGSSLEITATGYSGTYDGKAHGISVSCSGATITYGTSSSSYNLSSSPTYTNAGVYTVYYKVSKNGYADVTGSKTVTINKATGSGSVTMSSWAYGATASNPSPASTTNGTSNVTYNYTGTTNSGTAYNSSTKPSQAGSYKVTATFAATTNYNSCTASTSFNINKATGSGSVTMSSWTYGATASNPSPASTTNGTSNITYNYTGTTNSGTAYNSSTKPSQAGSYKVTATFAATTNYNSCTASGNFTINRAVNSLVLSATSGTLTYPNNGSFTVKTNTGGGALTISNSNTTAVTASLSGTTITLIPCAITSDTSAVITVNSAQTANYNAASASFKLGVKQGTFSVKTTDYIGTYDGNEHSISIEYTYMMLNNGVPTQKTIVNDSNGLTTYWTSENSSKVKVLPLFKDASVTPYTSDGKYVVYYQVAKAGYKTVTGEAYVTINRADGKVSLDKESSTIKFAENDTFNITENISGGALSVQHVDANICNLTDNDIDEKELENKRECAKDVVNAMIKDNVVNIEGAHTGSSVISVISAQTRNYNEAKADCYVQVRKAYNEAKTVALKPLSSLELNNPLASGFDGLINSGLKDSSAQEIEYEVNEPSVAAYSRAAVASSTDVELTYPNETSLAVTQNISGGEIIVESSNTNIASAWVSGNVIHVKAESTPGLATIIVTISATEDYNSLTTSFSVRVTKGSLYVDTEPYSGVYDGHGHGINLTVSADAKVTYSTEYDGEYTEEEPLYTKVGTYVTYYRVECDGYYTVKGYDTVEINKASSKLALSSTSGVLSYPKEMIIDVSTQSNGKITVTSDDPSIAEATLTENNKILVKGGSTFGTTKIKVNIAETEEYRSSSTIYTITVIEGTFDVSAQGYSGIYDGKEHSITLECAQSSATIKYRDSEQGEFSSDVPKYTDAGKYTTYYQISETGYNTVEGSVDVIIENADFVPESYSYECEYDGLPHTINVNYDGATVKYGETEDCSLIEAPMYTDVGTYKIFYSVSNNNYNTYTDYAIITINKAQLDGDNIFEIEDTLGETPTISDAPVNKPNSIPVTTGIPITPDVPVTAPEYNFKYDGTGKSIAVRLNEAVEGIGNIVYKYFDIIKNTWRDEEPIDSGVYQEWVYVEGSTNNDATDMKYVTTFEIIPAVPSMDTSEGKLSFDIPLNMETFELNNLVDSDAEMKFSIKDGNALKVTEDGIATIVGLGTTIIKVETIPTNNYASVEPIYVTITVTKNTIDSDNANNYLQFKQPENTIYNGEQQPVVITPTSGEELGTITIYYKLPDGTLTEEPPTNVGRYEVFITTSGSSNFEPITEPLKVGETVIEKAESSDVSFVLPEDFTYTGEDLDIKVTTSNGEDVGELEYIYKNAETGEIVDKVVDAGRYEVYVKPAGSENFNTSEEPIKVGTIVVDKATLDQEEDTLTDKFEIPNIIVPEDGVNIKLPNDLEDGAEIYYKEVGSDTYIEGTPSVPGKYEVYVNITGNKNYNPSLSDTKVGEFTLDKFNSLIIVSDDNYNKTYGDPDFSLEAQTTSDSPITFEIIEGDDVVSVSAGKISIKNAGMSKVRLYTEESDSYKAAEKMVTINVAKKETLSDLVEKPNSEVKFETPTSGLTANNLDLSKYPGWTVAPGCEDIELTPGTTTEIKLIYTGEGSENYENTQMTIIVTMPICIHSWDKGHTLVHPTDTTEGTMEYTCLICNMKNYKPIPNLGSSIITPDIPSVVTPDIPSVVTPDIPSVVTPDTPSVVTPDTPSVVTPDTPSVVTPGITKNPTASITKNPTAKPIITQTPTQDPNFVKVGTVIKVGNHYYKVTKDIYKGSTVTYLKPANKKLTKVTIPATVKIKSHKYKVTGIVKNAFSKCTKLKTVKIGKNVKSIGTKAFYKCVKLTKITIGTNVTSIGNEAFMGCTALKTIKIPSKVKTIGSKAFYNCSKLKKVTLGTKVTTIKSSAFGKCKSLISITIPKNVTTLGKSVFTGCKKLKSITIKSSKLKSKKINNKAFKGLPTSVKIKVPSKKLKTYKKLFVKKGLSKKIKVTK